MKASRRSPLRLHDLSSRPKAIFAITLALLSLISACWALATPISSSPDEPAHLVKAASVARGEFIGPASTTGNIVTVPRYIAESHSLTCMAFIPEQSAACQPDSLSGQGDIVEARTTAGLYNPIYYLVVGTPSLLFDSEVGIYAMRIVSGIFASVFFALSIMMLSTWRRPALPLLSMAVMATPMLFYLNASVNPNAVEATGLVAVFVALLSVLREPDDRLLWSRSLIMMISAVVTVNARGLSPLWLAVIVLVCLMLVRRSDLVTLLRSRPIQVAIAGTFLASLFAVIWLLSTNSLAAAVSDPDARSIFPGAGLPWYIGAWKILDGTFTFSEGLIGLFGWLDTPAHPGIYFTWAGFVTVLLLAGFASSKGSTTWFLLALVASFLFLPALVQGAYITDGGFIWQGRYNFPLFACLIVGLAAVASWSSISIPRPVANRAVGLALAAWVACQVGAFATTLQRYVTGTEASWVAFFLSPEWQPPGGSILVLFLLLAAAAAFAVTLGAVTRPRAGSREPITPIEHELQATR